jgi:hypothetical protein
MEQPKCKSCGSDSEWYYETKNDSDFYCEEHVPCGWFKKFVAKYIIPIIPFELILRN